LETRAPGSRKPVAGEPGGPPPDDDDEFESQNTGEEHAPSASTKPKASKAPPFPTKAAQEARKVESRSNLKRSLSQAFADDEEPPVPSEESDDEEDCLVLELA